MAAAVRAFLAFPTLALTSALGAQGITGGGLDGNRIATATELRSELARLQKRLATATSQHENLVESLAHHALGYEVRLDLGEAPILNSAQIDATRAQLGVLERDLGHRRREYRDLKRRVELNSAVAAASTRNSQGSDVHPLWTDEPTAESLPGSVPAAPGPETIPGPGPSTVTNQLPISSDPEKPRRDGLVVVRGSTNHAKVARLLYQAAHSLKLQSEQLARSGDFGEAAEYRRRSRTKYEQALQELERLVADPDSAAFPDLFHHGKCLIGVFDLDVAEGKVGIRIDLKTYTQRTEALRQPFLQINSRDSKAVNGQDVLGPWGQTAESVLKQLRWRVAQDGRKPLRPKADWQKAGAVK